MKKGHLNSTDFNLWHAICEETEATAATEPMLASLPYQTILRHQSLGSTLTYHLFSRLGNSIMDVRVLFETYQQALSADTRISKCVEADLRVTRERDPARDEYSLPLLYSKGFHTVQAYRTSHWPYQDSRKTLTHFLQNRMLEVFGAGIHPAARFSHGLMLDHTTNFVASETAALGSNVPTLHGIMLGGSGKEGGDRHPKIGGGVMIDANTSILGNIRTGKNVKIDAGGAMVINASSSITVVGVPAKPAGRFSKTSSTDTDQSIQLSSTDSVV